MSGEQVLPRSPENTRRRVEPNSWISSSTMAEPRMCPALWKVTRMPRATSTVLP